MFIGLLSVCAIGSFGAPLASNYKEPINFVSLNYRPCQPRPNVNINSNETLFCPFNVIVNKCCGGCNIIDDPYAQVCVPNKVKNINAKIFNLMSRVNETKFLVQHEL